MEDKEKKTDRSAFDYFVRKQMNKFDGDGNRTIDLDILTKVAIPKKKQPRVSKLPFFFVELIHEYIPDNEEIIILQGKMKRKLIKETKEFKRTTRVHFWNPKSTTDFKVWFNKNGKIHRDGDKPAIVSTLSNNMCMFSGGKDEKRFWVKGGKIQRNGKKPAVVKEMEDCYDMFWYENGEIVESKFEMKHEYRNKHDYGFRWDIFTSVFNA